MDSLFGAALLLALFAVLVGFALFPLGVAVAIVLIRRRAALHERLLWGGGAVLASFALGALAAALSALAAVPPGTVMAMAILAVCACALFSPFLVWALFARRFPGRVCARLRRVLSVNQEKRGRFRQKRSDWWAFGWVLGVLVVCAGLVAGVFLYHEDHREEIAKAILFGDGERLSTLNVALAARFPTGSQLADVVAFVEKQGGHCGGKAEGAWHCRLLLSENVAVVSHLDIKVALAANRTVSSVVAKMASTGW